jgi:hypothetical protein
MAPGKRGACLCNRLSGSFRSAKKGLTEMSNDPLVQLEAVIASAAQERDQKNQKSRDEQAAQEKRRDQARDLWIERKNQLPAFVEIIDRMLREHGYEGLALGVHDLKHSDVDRIVLDFAHSLHSHTRILLCLTTVGEFTCAVGAIHNDPSKIKFPIEQLSEERFKEVLAKAVEECLSGKRNQRPL